MGITLVLTYNVKLQVSNEATHVEEYHPLSSQYFLTIILYELICFSVMRIIKKFNENSTNTHLVLPVILFVSVIQGKY